MAKKTKKSKTPKVVHSMKIGQKAVYRNAKGEKKTGVVETLHEKENRATVLPRGYKLGRKPILDPEKGWAFSKAKNRWEKAA